MASTNPSAMLAESLADFSKAAYQAFTEIENQSREEVAHAVAETRGLKVERDRALRDVQTLQLDAQAWKEEAATSKATLTQAELTIAHQAETLANQLETIAQLRREINQWKDQSRNWQEHFLRVEQERCAQSSRIDELVVEKLQFISPSTKSGSTLSTPKTLKYTSHNNSAPSSTTTKRNLPSPTQPPAYKAAASPGSDLQEAPEPNRTSGPVALALPLASESSAKQSKGNSKPQAHAQRNRGRDRDVPPDAQEAGVGRKQRKRNGSTSAGKPMTVQSQHAPTTTRSSTVIRRVHAVIHVKREDDSEDEAPDPVSSSSSSGVMTAAKGPVAIKKKKEESVDGSILFNRRRLSSSKRRALVSEDESGSEEGNGYNLRRQSNSQVNYREEDEDDEEEDELMMGAEDNHAEVYGAYPVDPQTKQQSISTDPPKKKRKFAAR